MRRIVRYREISKARVFLFFFLQFSNRSEIW